MGSKSKRRDLFGTVLAFAAIIATGGAATPYVAAWLTAAAVVYSGLNAAYNARQMKKQAADAMAASLEDRKMMIKGGTVPLNYVYGNAWTSGVVVFAREAKDRDDPYFWLVMALPIAHHIHAINDIYFGEERITPVDSNGNPTGGTFVKHWKNSTSAQGLVPHGNRIRVLGRPEDRLQQGEIEVTSVQCSIRRFYPMGNDDTNPWVSADEVTETYQPPYNPYNFHQGDSAPYIQPTYYPVNPAPVDNSGMNAGDGWQAPQYTPQRVQHFPDAGAYVVPGSKNEIHIPGNVGDEFTLTYEYRFTHYHVSAWWYWGRSDQVAHAGLIAATQASGTAAPQWTSNSKLTNIPYIIMRFRVDPDIFPNNLENITVKISGKRCFDPRDSVTRFTTNPIIIARDYLISECGVQANEINLPLLIQHANACDDAIPLPSYAKYNYHPLYNIHNKHDVRYAFNGVLSTEAEPINNLGVILSSCDGTAVFSGATLDLRCGLYEEPSMTLDDGDFAGPPEVTVTTPRQDHFNGIRARFMDTEQLFWPIAETPTVVSEYWLSQDRGVESVREIDLSCTPNPHMAQRVAKQMLNRSRSPLRLRAQFKPAALSLSPEQTVFVKLRSLGMMGHLGQGKTFRVKSLRPVNQALVEVDMQEDAAALYAWDFKEGVWADPTPNSNLPNVRVVPDIEGLGCQTSQAVAVFGPGGDLTARCRVYWNPITDPLVLAGGFVEVQYKRSQDFSFTSSGPLPPTTREFYFPVKNGDYLVIQVRAGNSLVKGAWSPFLKWWANDAPTPYITGNMIRNASLIWTKHEVEGYTYPLFNVDGWKYFTNPYRELNREWYYDYIAPLDDPSGQFLEHEQTGFIRIPESVTFQAPYINVKPGDRMVAYASLYAYNTEIDLDLWYFGKHNSPVGLPHLGLPFVRRTSSQADPDPDPSAFTRVGIFSTVPRDAAYARFSVKVGTAIDSNFWAMGFIGNPYYGRASPAQVQYPPWSS